MAPTAQAARAAIWEALKNGWLLVAPDAYEAFDMSEPILRTPNMSKEEVSRLCADIYRTFLRPRFMLRHLLRVRSVGDLEYLWRGLLSVLGHLRDFLSGEAKQ